MPNVHITDGRGFQGVAVNAEQIDQYTQTPGVGEFFLALKADPDRTAPCPLCNWTVEDALKTGLLGCGLCYSSVYPEYQRRRQTA